MQPTLLKNVNVYKGSTVALESTIINSNIVNMAGYEGCMFIAVGSTLWAASSSITMRVQGSTANSTTAMVSYGTTVGVINTTALGAAGGTDKLLVLDCYRPTEQYIRAQITGTSSGSANWVIVQYGPRRGGSSALNASTMLTASTAYAGGSTA